MSKVKLLLMAVLLIVLLVFYFLSPPKVKDTTLDAPPVLAPEGEPSAANDLSIDRQRAEEPALDLDLAEDAIEQGVARKQPFAESTMDSLERIVLRYEGEEKQAEKRAKHFPLKDGGVVNVEVLAQLIDDIAQISLANEVVRLSSKEEAAQFGLYPAVMQVQLGFDENQLELRFGNEHPVTKRRYFTYGDAKTVYSLDSFYFDSMLKHFQELEEERIIAFTSEWLTALAVTIEDAGLSSYAAAQAEEVSTNYRILRHSFDVDDLGQWLVASGAQEYPAASDFFERKLASLQVLQGEEVSAQQAELAQENALFSLSLVLNRENSYGLRLLNYRVFSDEKRGYYRLHNLDSGVLHRVFGGQYKDFLQGPLQFRNRKPFLAAEGLLSSLAEDVEQADAATLDAKTEQFLRTFEVLSYDPIVQEENFSDPQARHTFTLGDEKVVLTVGKRLQAADTSEAAQRTAPAYLRIEQGEQPPLQAVISAVELKRLEEL